MSTSNPLLKCLQFFIDAFVFKFYCIVSIFCCINIRHLVFIFWCIDLFRIYISSVSLKFLSLLTLITIGDMKIFQSNHPILLFVFHLPLFMYSIYYNLNIHRNSSSFLILGCEMFMKYRFNSVLVRFTNSEDETGKIKGYLFLD